MAIYMSPAPTLKSKMTAQELKEKILGKIVAKEYHVIGLDKTWWHVHDNEEVPEEWALKKIK